MKVDFSTKIPDYVISIADKLKESGFSCYLVGGAVRDIVMNIEPKDYDLATDALPEQMARIFPKSVLTNAKFGTVIVLSGDKEGENHSVEVTTFRSEADYIDGRWPSKVEFTSDLHKDLGRRDFTINAMAIDLQVLDDGIEGNDLVDLFGGKDDITAGLIRAVGTPVERMTEDGLRAFKACRLASELEFQIEGETFESMKNSVNVARQISIERIRDEFMKLLMNSPKPSAGIELLREAGLLEIFLQELLEGIGVAQPEKYHVQNVYDHILATVDAADDSVKLAALFHDIGKPRCKENDHFYRHDVTSAEMAREVMMRMKFPKLEIDRVYRLVRWHMFVYADWRKGEIESNWSDSAIRRFVRNIGGEEYVDDIFKLRMADALSNPKSSFDPREIQALESRIAEVRAQDMALNVEDLNISGHDLMTIGVKPGPRMGAILKELLEKVLDDPGLNTTEQLIKLAEEML